MTPTAGAPGEGAVSTGLGPDLAFPADPGALSLIELHVLHSQICRQLDREHLTTPRRGRIRSPWSASRRSRPSSTPARAPSASRPHLGGDGLPPVRPASVLAFRAGERGVVEVVPQFPEGFEDPGRAGLE